MKLLLAFAAASLAAMPALAANDAPTAAIKYKDLDLATKRGRAALDRRIRVAARDVCGQGVQTGTRIQPNRCIEDAVKVTKASLASRGVGAAVASR